MRIIKSAINSNTAVDILVCMAYLTRHVAGKCLLVRVGCSYRLEFSSAVKLRQGRCCSLPVIEVLDVLLQLLDLHSPLSILLARFEEQWELPPVSSCSQRNNT